VLRVVPWQWQLVQALVAPQVSEVLRQWQVVLARQ
jgi:hypothetical protein